MRTKVLLGLLTVTVFGAGVYLGSEVLRREKTIQLHLEVDRQAGHVTTYTFYHDVSGAEIKHGDYREFTMSGRLDVRRQYEHGRLVGGVGIIN